MILQCLGKYEDIVQIHNHNPFYYEVSKNIIHHSLEYCRAVSHTEEYHQEFKESVVSIKYLVLQSCDTSLEVRESKYLVLIIIELRIL